MQRFKYVGTDEIYMPAAERVVKPGDVFDVEPDVARGLVGQDNFEKVTTKQPAAKGQKEE